MFDDPLSLPARASVTITALVFVLIAHRALFRRASAGASRVGAFAFGGAFVVAAAFAHVQPLIDTLPSTFGFGLVAALGAAVASLFSARARLAFDELDDAEVRLLLSVRAIFGALLLALGSLGHFPVAFALSAGLGDLAVTWIAFAIPASLGADGPRWARLLAHGVGLADMTMVLFLAVTMVRPWSIAHGNATTAMTLPWLAVPLMFAINAHGVRRAAFARARDATPVGDGSEPAGHVRSALP
jgi:hypothetical protein